MSGRGDFAFSDRVDYGAALLAQVRAAAVPALAEILFKLRKAEKQLVGREIFFAVEIEAGKAGRVGDKMPVGERKERDLSGRVPAAPRFFRNAAGFQGQLREERGQKGRFSDAGRAGKRANGRFFGNIPAERVNAGAGFGRRDENVIAL